MTIPQVNALATKREQERTQRICELKGYAYYPAHELDVQYRQDATALAWKSPEDNRRLPNGSLTLCQVVGMLEAEEVAWVSEGWVAWLPNKNYRVIWKAYSPFDLTAALDALIKVLETKGEKE